MTTVLLQCQLQVPRTFKLLVAETVCGAYGHISLDWLSVWTFNLGALNLQSCGKSGRGRCRRCSRKGLKRMRREHKNDLGYLVPSGARTKEDQLAQLFPIPGEIYCRSRLQCSTERRLIGRSRKKEECSRYAEKKSNQVFPECFRGLKGDLRASLYISKMLRERNEETLSRF